MYAALSVATGIAPSVLMAEPDEMINTMIEVMEESGNDGG